MKKNYSRHLFALVVLMAFCAISQTADALGQKELQQLLDGQISATTRASADGFTEIDISGYTEPFTSTLYVRSNNVRFINGMLTQAESLIEPLIAIQNGFTLELPQSVTLSGNEIESEHSLVEVQNGKLSVTGGAIERIYGWFAMSGYPGPERLYSIGNVTNNNAVELKGSDASFTITAGRIVGSVNNEEGGNISIEGGDVGPVQTSQPIWLSGSATTWGRSVSFTNENAYITLSSALQCTLRISGYSVDQEVVQGYNIPPAIDIIKGGFYIIEEDDVNRMYLVDNSNNYRLSLENNSVYVRENSSPIRTIEDVEPGALPSRILEADREIIEELTITGKLNGTDIKLIRDMACKKLRKLDISGCSIVEGGEAYLSTNEFTPSSDVCTSSVYVESDVFYPVYGAWNTANDVISYYMFAGLTTLETLILPYTAVTIETGAFMDSPKLANITFGKSLTNIPSGFIFYGSNNVSNLYFDSSNTAYTASNGVIYSKDKTVIIAVSPSKSGTFGISSVIDSIAPHAFADCLGITDITFNGYPTRINSYAFSQSGLSTISIPASVKSIDNGAFMSCEKLNSVVFNENLESIGYGAFAHCNLTELDLSMTMVSELGGDGHSYPIATPYLTYTYHIGVFEGTNTLTTVKLPSTIKTIGGKAFTSSKITDIYCYNNPATIWYQYQYTPAPGQLGGTGFGTSDTFVDIDYATCRLHVPSNAVESYKEATGWKEFTNIVGDQASIPDPNTVYNEDDLQKRLDEIAAQNPDNPVNITICDEGIVLTKGIRAEYNSKAIISGGPISVKDGFGDDALFYVNNSAYLSFSNIIIDFVNARYLPSCFFVSDSGILEITESVEYKNISTITIKGWASNDGFYRNNGRMILCGGDASGIEGYVISNSGVVEMRGDIFKYGINIYNYYERIMNGGLNKLGTIRLLSSIPETVLWTFNGNWDGYPMETPFIESSESYTLQASDYWQMRFTGLPTAECDGRTQYYDGSTHNIKLKDFSSLQCLLDNSGEEVDVPCEGVDADKNVNLDLQTLLDGGGCNDSETEHPLIRLPGGCVFFPEMPVMPLEPTIVRDVTFDSYSSGHRVYVRREVTFERNVKARNFLVFTIVEKGGHLIWQNALTENVLYPLYNDGGVVDIVNGKIGGIVYNLAEGKMSMSGDVTANVIENSGTLVMEGNVKLSEIRLNSKSRISLTSKLTSKWVVDLTGDGTAEYESSQVIVEGYGDYKITAEDFDNLECQIPEGYGVVLDTAHNAIVLLKPEQLSGVKGVRIADSDDGNFYTLEGVKVNPPVKKGFYIKNGKKFVVK